MKGKSFLSEWASIRTITLSLAPLHFPRVSFWIYFARLRPRFFHLNIIQENILAEMGSSPSSMTLFTHSLLNSLGSATISHRCWIQFPSLCFATLFPLSFFHHFYLNFFLLPPISLFHGSFKKQHTESNESNKQHGWHWWINNIISF